jgi:hypothetical protein
MEVSGRHDAMHRYYESFGGGFVCEALPPERRKPQLIDQVREEIRKRHYSRRIERSYVGWGRRFIQVHCKRHPVEVGEVERFRRFVFVSPGGARGVSGYAGGPSPVEVEVCQQDAHGRAGSSSRYTAAARPAIYFASSTYF